MNTDLILAAVNQNGWALLYVRNKTPEICLAAVLKGKWATVPTEYYGPRARHVGVLQYVPNEIRTPEFYREAVRQNGMMLHLVPEALKTRELCIEALNRNGKALQFVPEALKQELSMIAVTRSGDALHYVPDKRPDICLEAVRQNGMALIFVPAELKTPELCMEAVNRNGKALQYVPPHLRDQLRPHVRDMANYNMSGFATSATGYQAPLSDELKRTPGGVIHGFLGGKSRKRRKLRKRTKRYH